MRQHSGTQDDLFDVCVNLRETLSLEQDNGYAMWPLQRAVPCVTLVAAAGLSQARGTVLFMNKLECSRTEYVCTR